MRTVKVDIFNSTYELKTDVPEEELNNIIGILNKKIEKLNKNAGTISTHKLAILLALQFAAEHYYANKKLEKILKKINLYEKNDLGYLSPEI